MVVLSGLLTTSGMGRGDHFVRVCWVTPFVPDPVGREEGLGSSRAPGLSLGTALQSGPRFSPVEGGAAAEAQETLPETVATGSEVWVH